MTEDLLQGLTEEYKAEAGLHIFRITLKVLLAQKLNHFKSLYT